MQAQPDDDTAVIVLGAGEAGWSCSYDESLGFVGTSAALERTRLQIRRAATSSRSVLVQGPTGAGKELVVEALARLSPNQRLVDINCSAIPEALMESQLFGHEKGAFTNAHARHHGYFSEVGDGTLFLDEIGELPLPLQAKLLRVLESRRFYRVGSCEPCTFRGRVVAATHVDLAKRVEDGRFRRDLYFRLNVLSIKVPALDEHREDIPLLLSHFCRVEGRTLSFRPAALRALARRSWLGNVRELRNVAERLLCHCASETISPERIADILDEADGSRGTSVNALDEQMGALLALGLPNLLEAAIDALVDGALRLTHDNKSAAAELLGVHRKCIERLVRRRASGALIKRIPTSGVRRGAAD
jgi:DNA-binding NtrC family response regulator